MERIGNAEFRELVLEAEEAARLIKRGMTVAVSGYTPSGYPKAVPEALVELHSQDRDFWVDLWAVAVGPEIDGEMGSHGLIRRRLPFQTDPILRKAANVGAVDYVEIRLEKVPSMLRSGSLGSIDVLVVEAVAITQEGHLVLGPSVGFTPLFAQLADKIIIEVNESLPMELAGFHDLWSLEAPPHTRPIPITAVGQRIGTRTLQVDPEKIVGIVFADKLDTTPRWGGTDPASKAMGLNFLDLLEAEIRAGRIPPELLPLQTGLGGIANGIAAAFRESSFEGLQFWCGILPDSLFDLIDEGKVQGATGGAFTPTRDVLARIVSNPSDYRDKVVLRPGEITNNGEVISRLGVIAMNTALEADIYGHINASHLMGSRVVNGVGGGCEFARNAYLSVFFLPSLSKGKISGIVPMVTHVDHTEHDVDLLITEQGMADLRGLGPRQRARAIIERCAHPQMRPCLWDYLERAEAGGGHEPHLLEESFGLHAQLAKEGTMLGATGERS